MKSEMYESKSSYCKSHPAVASYFVSPFVSILVHGIEKEDMEQYVYCSSNYADDKIFYHRVPIKYDKDGEAYFTIISLKVYLSECIKLDSPWVRDERLCEQTW